MASKRKKLTTPAQRIRESLREILHALQTGDSSRLTIREVSVEGPKAWSPADVRALRDRLGVSQRVFAEMLAVSPVLVEHWEYGRRSPAPIACRLLDQIAADPSKYVSDVIKTRKAS
jgi:putative transcriptional regulator